MVQESLEKPEVKSKKPRQCSKCGGIVHDHASFCSECGTKVEKLEANVMTCLNCGKEVPKSKFCVACGTKQKITCNQCHTELV